MKTFKFKIFPVKITAILKNHDLESWVCPVNGLQWTFSVQPVQALILKVKLCFCDKPYVVNKSTLLHFYQRPNCFSCDFWWKTNVTPLDHAPFNIRSSRPFRSAQWFHCDRLALQSVPSGGGWTWMLFTHRRHLNLYRKGRRHC